MNCQEVNCSRYAKFLCASECFRFCDLHYRSHWKICKLPPTPIEDAVELSLIQITMLNHKVVQIKSQIIEFTNKLVLSIKNSMKNILKCLDQEKLLVIKKIQMCKSEAMIKELIDSIPSCVLSDTDQLKSLFDLELKFNFHEFKCKSKAICRKFKSNPLNVQQEVNPVPEILAKLDFNGRMKWCKDQKLSLISENCLDDIRISSDAKFIFICKTYKVCKR